MTDLRVLVLAIPDPNGTGGERRSWNILNMMAKRGVNLHVVLDEFCQAPLSLAGFDYTLLRGTMGRLIDPRSSLSYPVQVTMVSKLVKEIRKEILRFHPDIVVAHNETTWDILSVKSASLNEPWTALIQALPIGLSYLAPHVREVLPLSELCKNYVKFALCRKVLNALRATTPIFVSEAVNIEMQSYGLGLENYYVLEIPEGLDWDEIRHANSSRVKYDAIFMSRLVPEKGIFDLIHVWRNVTKVLNDASLCIMGRFGNCADKIKTCHMIKNFGLERNVIIKDYLSGRDKFSVMKSASVFLYTSRQDSVSIAVLEALACGLPVVAYKIPAMTVNYPIESVIKTEIGNYEKMAQTVVGLLKDPLLRRRLSQTALSFSQKFTWETATECELNAYRKMLEVQNKVA